ncbi:MAG: hypothetical protein HKN80_05895, partial [Acidimicrobiia bacterium]|nr:hypothetical protein [Acidimicrobiia bacterium]
MNREAADLTEALRDLPGVADAELAADSAEGVRVRLLADADPTDVAAAVRDVLAEHGLKGKMAPPQAHIEPAGPPPPPSATILPGPGLVQTTLIPGEMDEEPVGDLGSFMRPPEPVGRPEGQSPQRDPVEVLDETGDPGEPADPDRTAPPVHNRGLLSRVLVHEDRDGVAVTVHTADDRTLTRRGRP